MKKITTQIAGRTFTGYSIQAKNSMVKSEIKRTFFTGKGKDRVRMYETTDGRQFVADVYDQNFNVRQTRVLPNNYKGKNPCSKVLV